MGQLAEKARGVLRARTRRDYDDIIRVFQVTLCVLESGVWDSICWDWEWE